MIGSRAEEASIAGNLYEILREFDQSDVEQIYSEAFYTPKMGQAIMNRLLKAAGHKVILVGKEVSKICITICMKKEEKTNGSIRV